MINITSYNEIGGDAGVPKARWARFIVVVILSMCIFVILTNMIAAEHRVTEEVQQQMSELDRIAAEVYEAAKQKKWTDMREDIEQLQVWIPQIKYEGITDVEGMNALTEAALYTESRLNEVQLSPHDVIVAAARLRLAVDALTHPHQPMWLQYYKWFKQGEQQMEASLKLNNPNKFGEAVQQVKEKYEMIRPAVQINRESEVVVKMDSLLHYLQQTSNSESYNYQQLKNAITAYVQTYNEIFQRESTDTYIPLQRNDLPYAGMISFGGVIITVLAVAGWRIYRYERKVGFVPVKKRTRDY